MLHALHRHSLGDLLTRTAARLPQKTALVWRDRRETFAALDQTVNRCANALRLRGVQKGARIAILSHNHRDFVILHFALARLGAIMVPVNFMLNAAEVAFILDHSGASGIIVEAALVETMEAAVVARKTAAAITLRGIIDGVAAGWTPVAEWLAHEDARAPEVDIADTDTLQLLYTSGTESAPKGAALCSRNLIAQYASCVIDGEMTAEDVEIHALPLYHCAQLHVFLVPDLMLGATSILLPGPDPATVLALIERERVTKLFCPPTVWIALLRHPDFDRRDLSSLAKGYYGASIMPRAVIQELSERLPQVRLFNCYGQTELSPLATVLRPEDQLRKLGSAGRACLNVQTQVVDDDDRPLPTGDVGEIVHRSPHTMLGYWNDPAKTAEAFRNGWFHSGDLGYVDEEGYLFVVDRKKDMIKTGGENVASREVEEALYQHPAVAEVAVFGISHPRWIEAVVAAVVLKPGADANRETLNAHCRERLAGFKSPKYLVLVDALPKNASGKILKRELRQRYADLAEH